MMMGVALILFLLFAYLAVCELLDNRKKDADSRSD